MNVSLRPEMERFVEQKVRTGQYASAEEAVNALLSQVRDHEGFAAEVLTDHPSNGSGEGSGERQRNNDMLNALALIEETRAGMAPKKDPKDYLREARSGAMYGVGD